MSAPALRSVFRFNRLNFRPWSATRCVFGIGVPLFVASATGHPGWGILASLGALYAGFNSFRGAYVSRLRSMGATTLLMSVATLVGSLISGSPIVGAAVIGVWAFSLALFATLSTTATMLSIQGTALLVVCAGLPSTAAEPFANALMVFAGGVLQILIMTAIWPFDPHYPERRAVDRVYVSLAQYVAEMRLGEAPAIPDAEPLREARTMVAAMPSQDQRILLPLRVAETIRAGIVGLAREDERLRRSGPEGMRRADEVATAVEHALRCVAEDVHHGRECSGEVPDCSTDVETWQEHGRWANLIGQAFIRLRSHPAEIPNLLPEQAALTLRTLFSSSALRVLSLQHATRFGFVVAGASLIGHAWKTPHAYWLPLTVCILLRADYATTVNRGLARLIGTLVGVAVATAIAALNPGAVGLSALILVVAWLACSVYLANYALFTGLITCFAVFSVAATAAAQREAAGERILATLAGAAIALAANILWPIWQSRKVSDMLREAADCQVEYGERVLGLFDGGSIVDTDSARHTARTVRIEAERVVEAALLEPVWSRRRMPPDFQDTLDRLDENAAVLLSAHAQALHAKIAGSGPAAGRQEAEAHLQDSRRLLQSLSIAAEG